MMYGNGEKKVWQLRIDKEFKAIIRPLFKPEYLQLEENLLADGCRDPIVAWNGVIIDGHNRYEICTRHNIPFAVSEMDFDCREAVVAWICTNQLGRRNLTEEARKFLIGMQYEAEKEANTIRNTSGRNQYSSSLEPVPYEEFDPNNADVPIVSKYKTANRIAQENHISHGTVEKYAIYSRALTELRKKHSPIVAKILSGKLKISHANLLELSRKSAEEIKRINRRLDSCPQPFIQYQTTRKELQEAEQLPSTEPAKPAHTVKDMPTFDPDAEITGLTLTIPSWISSINRIRTKTDLSIISVAARCKLEDALIELQNQIMKMLSSIREE